MNETQQSASSGIGPKFGITKNAAAVVQGIGAGLLIATVFYRYFSIADLTDSLRIAGFGLLLWGGYHRKGK